MFSLAEYDRNFDPTAAMLAKVEVIHEPADECKWANWQVVLNTGRGLKLSYCGYDDAAEEAAQIALHHGQYSVMLLA